MNEITRTEKLAEIRSAGVPQMMAVAYLEKIEASLATDCRTAGAYFAETQRILGTAAPLSNRAARRAARSW